MTHDDRTQAPSTPREKSLPQEKGYPSFSLWFFFICQLHEIVLAVKNLHMFLHDWEKPFENYIFILVTSIQLENIDVFNTGSGVS